MGRPLLVFENIETTPRRKLFTLLGVDWLATPYAWLSPCFFCALGIVMAFISEPSRTLAIRILTGVVYGIMLYICNEAHSVGHVLAGRIVGVPMNANLLTATRDVNLYYGPRRAVPGRTRIGRSLGGPAANLFVGLLFLGLWALLRVEWLLLFAYCNVGIGVFAFMPIPTVDGWVIWSELIKGSVSRR
jgi:hypothetical protein